MANVWAVHSVGDSLVTYLRNSYNPFIDQNAPDESSLPNPVSGCRFSLLSSSAFDDMESPLEEEHQLSLYLHYLMTAQTNWGTEEMVHNAVTLLERSLMMTEQSDRCILAAIRCVDGITLRPIQSSLQLSALGSRFIRNRSGDYILLTTPEFEFASQSASQSASHSFRRETLAAAPPPTPLDITLIDPSSYYLPRKFSLALPRPADPTADDCLFKTLTVPLYPSPLASQNSGWAVLHTRIVNATRQLLPWTLIEIIPEVVQSGQSATILAQADWRGEALIVVPGIPGGARAPAADAPVTTQSINIQINLLFDASQVTPLPADTDFSNNPNRDYVPNPDALLANRAALLTSSHSLAVAAGSDRALTLTLTSPYPNLLSSQE